MRKLLFGRKIREEAYLSNVVHLLEVGILSALYLKDADISTIDLEMIAYCPQSLRKRRRSIEIPHAACRGRSWSYIGRLNNASGFQESFSIKKYILPFP